MSDVTRILSQIEAGNPAAAEELLPLVYDELRKLAAARLAHEKPGQTLQATALVHDAYLRLVDQPNRQAWQNSRHFFAAAAESMRRILVENARRKQRVRHGGGQRRVELSDCDLATNVSDDELLAIDEALLSFAAIDPIKAELIKLRFFVGLSVEDAAQTLGISRATANRNWTYARAWLFAELTDPAKQKNLDES